MSKAELLNRITVLFGGRAAEELVFGDITTGAHDDIRKATDLARRMVTEYGMSRRLGAVDYYSGERGALPGAPPADGQSIRSPETAETIEAEVRRLLDRCHKRAHEILCANREVLERMAQSLLEIEVLDGERMETFLAEVQHAETLADPPSEEWEREGGRAAPS